VHPSASPFLKDILAGKIERVFKDACLMADMHQVVILAVRVWRWMP